MVHNAGVGRDRDAYAYVIDWEQRNAPKALAHLWAKKYKVRSARKEFNNGSRTYPRGTLVVLMGRNTDKTESVRNDMDEVAEKAGVVIEAFATGRMQDGIDFGSSNMVPLKNPTVGLMVDTPFNSYTAGQLWYLLDKETELGISKLRMSRLKSLNLNKYDVLLFPGVRGTVDSSLVNKLKTWVLNGGTALLFPQQFVYFPQ